MAQGKPRDSRKEQQWRRLIQLWKNSGLTVRAFCARHHITQPSFYAWRRELQQRDASALFMPKEGNGIRTRIKWLQLQCFHNTGRTKASSVRGD